ncbi:type 1 glutamine amidotransferase domain-containing protein [Nocardiopsis baichengensis]|uniref:type 1 glutamine amidotransferase domain-containing protein n=1 Tax=Nocardiopsis baichengensis TaxID=280240 RepID=UPI00034DBF69|nr:type 1 glutamine amidotransferase domain-containing protein [Nocardiopsis baichengensis]
MAGELEGRTVALLAADGVEQVELERPRGALQGAGARVELVSVVPGPIQAMNGDIEPADTFAVDRKVGEADPAAFDGLVVPGGTINPDRLRIVAEAVDFVRAFADSGRPIGAICHGPWILAEAGVARDRTVTSYPSIRTDLRNAGAKVVDEEVVTDRGVTTSRDPGDLTAFCDRLIEQIARSELSGAR